MRVAAAPKRVVILFTVLLFAFAGGCEYLLRPPDPRWPMRYEQDLSGAFDWLGDVRAEWVYSDNSYAQDPVYSLSVLSGDCDDFAILIAKWFQVYWGYDTFVLVLESCVSYRNDHAVCYVRESDCPPGYVTSLVCPLMPIALLGEVRYRPLDWTICPDWTWDDYNIGGYLLNRHTGLLEWCDALEWDEALNYYMRVADLPCRRGTSQARSP